MTGPAPRPFKIIARALLKSARTQYFVDAAENLNELLTLHHGDRRIPALIGKAAAAAARGTHRRDYVRGIQQGVTRLENKTNPPSNAMLLLETLFEKNRRHFYYKQQPAPALVATEKVIAATWQANSSKLIKARERCEIYPDQFNTGEGVALHHAEKFARFAGTRLGDVMAECYERVLPAWQDDYAIGNLSRVVNDLFQDKKAPRALHPTVTAVWKRLVDRVSPELRHEMATALVPEPVRELVNYRPKQPRKAIGGKLRTTPFRLQKTP